MPSLSSPNGAIQRDTDELDAYEAVRLFVDRALKVRPNFTLTARQRARDGADLLAPRRHPARDRAGGGAGAYAVVQQIADGLDRPIPPA